MIRRTVLTAVAASLILASVVGFTSGGPDPAEPSSAATPVITMTPPAAGPATVSAAPLTSRENREFMFQVMAYKTKNQGGQIMNMYFHYRYDQGIADTEIPNYEDLRSEALSFIDHVNSTQNPYWETLNKQLCNKLKSHYPIEAISCQLQIAPDDRPGLPYEPGFHSSIDTIGDIQPLAIAGPPGSAN